jgi:hypothetical protein
VAVHLVLREARASRVAKWHQERIWFGKMSRVSRDWGLGLVSG